MSVPRSRFTSVPAPLFHAHQGLSHSALTLLLSVIRATLGWARKEDGTVKYKRTAELSASDLEAMTGLSRPTVRSAAEELEVKSALYKRRKHGGAPWEYAVDFSFFQDHLQKSCAPTKQKKNSNNNTRTRETTSKNASTQGSSGSLKSDYRITEDWERDAITTLTASPFTVHYGRARDLVIRRSESVVQGAVREFHRREEEIKNPAGWVCQAIEDLWFGPKTANKSPDVRQSGTEQPMARAFEALTERQEGWEWDQTSGGGEARASPDSPGGQPTVGVSHSKMCGLIEDLRKPAGDWEPVERPGRNPVFVPSKELANWAYFQLEKNAGGEAFEEAACRVVNLRARHEGRKSPLPVD